MRFDGFVSQGREHMVGRVVAMVEQQRGSRSMPAIKRCQQALVLPECRRRAISTTVCPQARRWSLLYHLRYRNRCILGSKLFVTLAGRRRNSDGESVHNAVCSRGDGSYRGAVSLRLAS